MNQFIDDTYLEYAVDMTEIWVYDNVFIYSNLIQLCLIALTLLVSWYFTPNVKEWRKKTIVDKSRSVFRFLPVKYTFIFDSLILPLVWLLMLSFLLLIGVAVDTSYQLIKIVVSLLAAWIVIRLTTGIIKNRTLSKFIALVVWTVAAL